MSKAKRRSVKKEFRTKIAEQLSTTLSDLKERIGAKKFERRIRKASKMLSQGVKLLKIETLVKKKAEKKEKQK